jgi:benzoylformate decarboxylase
VIINNHGYAALEEFGRHFGMTSTVGTKLSGLDFCALARGQGVAATRVERAKALDAALSDSFRSSEPSLLEVVVEKHL